MKKLLAGLFALMALGLVLSGCKKDDDDDTEEEKKEEEVFTELAEADFDNAEEWLLGNWYGEMEEFDFDCSDSFVESQGKTKDELKNVFKELLTSPEEGETLLGDMEITEDNISKYIKFFHEMASNDDDKEIASDLKLSVNEDKTKFRILMNMEQSADDLWWKAKTSILYTKK
ncbi:hypothetical protein [uncultured Treponema sp.]|uniref:hypothetical protein n=1 Tax=uncultured Treponema sp. TaxID=162155 RepID=UPI000E8C6094|nr:hypothetical protein [uncultured Treponema sp.]HAZ97006.1 hypothetical protein [Treponema sp.]